MDLNIGRCKHCGKVFGPSLGMGAVLCRNCIFEANEAWPQALRYLKEEGFSTTDDLLANSGVPGAFVLAFIEDGRFGEFQAAAGPQKEASCNKCGAALSGGRVHYARRVS